MLLLRFVYAANIFVAGWIGLSSLFYPRVAARTVFQRAYAPSETVRLVGCLWLGIAFLSGAGLWRPVPLAAVLLLQLFYKSVWLVVVGLPAARTGQPYPTGMALFFVVWVLVLPFVIPWRHLLGF